MAIKHAILGLLHYRPMHGYKIKAQIEKNFGHVWSINYGQIYPNLKSLLDEGLISMTEHNQAGMRGPSRKLYSITDKGREAFSRWIMEQPEKSMTLRDPFLMKFVFFGFGERKRAIEMIDDQIELYEKQLGSRKEKFKKMKELEIHVRLISEMGIELNEAFLAWLKRAREEILQNAANEVDHE
jgi:DNA-binding PadR family transcriptional regulator